MTIYDLFSPKTKTWPLDHHEVPHLSSGTMMIIDKQALYLNAHDRTYNAPGIRYIWYLVVASLSEGVAQPFETLIETITRCRTSGLNVLMDVVRK